MTWMQRTVTWTDVVGPTVVLLEFLLGKCDDCSLQWISCWIRRDGIWESCCNYGSISSYAWSCSLLYNQKCCTLIYICVIIIKRWSQTLTSGNVSALEVTREGETFQYGDANETEICRMKISRMTICVAVDFIAHAKKGLGIDNSIRTSIWFLCHNVTVNRKSPPP